MKVNEIIFGATDTLRARVYAKIARLPGPNACWGWTGARSKKRGGARRPVIQVGRRRSSIQHVARVVLALADKVPLDQRAGLRAAHRCNNDWCVRLSHLRWATQSENENDKHEFDADTEYQQYSGQAADTEVT